MRNRETENLEIRFREPLTAGQIVSIVFDYTVGQTGLAQGGKLRIGLPTTGWAEPLVPQYYFWSEYARGKARRYTDYDRVNTTVKLVTVTDAYAVLETDTRFRKPWTYPPSWLRDFDRYWITAVMEDAPLEPGDRIVITYGDPEQLPLTARVQRYPEAKVCFLAFADTRGDGNFEEVAGSPWIVRIHAGLASRLQAVVPAVTRPYESCTVRVAYTDEVHAAPEPLPETARIEAEFEGQPETSRMEEINRAAASANIDMPQDAAAGEGARTRRIMVHDMERGFAALSNPTVVRSSGPRLFFGDLHAQSQYHGWNPVEKVGISCNTPRECYAYARDIAGLDFCAVTDTASITKNIWPEIVVAAQEMHAPGRFVTFQGSEVGDNVDGHRNLVFGTEGPQLGFEGLTPSERADGPQEMATAAVQERYAGREDVILIPHHVKMWLRWDRHVAELEPVLEIYSVWGCGEKRGTDMWILREMSGGAQEAWARGYRMGVIGGSDSHAGLPGRSLPDSDRNEFHTFKAGYAAVWADSLTRRDIFAALKARRCYATTGARIILEVFIENAPMGSEMPWPDRFRPRTLRIRFAGTDELDSVTIIKNNLDTAVFKLKGKQEGDIMWEDKTPAENGDYYYTRVVQADGNRAWSSPIWITVPG